MSSNSTRFKKYTLVSNEELERLRRRSDDHNIKSDAKISTLSQLQKDMKQLLSRSDIDAEEIMGIFQQLRYFFENIKASNDTTKFPIQPQQRVTAETPKNNEIEKADASIERKKQQTEAVLATAAPTPPPHLSLSSCSSTSHDTSFEKLPIETLDSATKFINSLNLPDRRIPKARLLIVKILKFKNYVSCSANGCLCINGKDIANSSFTDLFRELFVDKSTHNKTGMDKFLNILNKIHVSPDEISNSVYKKALEILNPIQKGNGFRSRYPPGKRLQILRVYPC